MGFQPSTHAVTHTVTDDDTAAAVGSGDLEVLATPRLLAWLEEATCGAVGLDAASTSVGTRVELEHLAPSPVGAEVTATATVVHRDGRLVRFQVVAHDAAGTVLATGEVQRVVVDRERFLSRLDEPLWETEPIASHRGGTHGQDRPQAPRASQEEREPRQAPQRVKNPPSSTGDFLRA